MGHILDKKIRIISKEDLYEVARHNAAVAVCLRQYEFSEEVNWESALINIIENLLNQNEMLNNALMKHFNIEMIQPSRIFDEK